MCAHPGTATCDDIQFFCDDGSVRLFGQLITEAGVVIAEATSCPDEAEPDPGPTLGDILRAFRSIPLPDSTIQIEPPDGETLVNFKTNFLTTAPAFNRTVTLLAHEVDFRIRATSYRWHFGDGTSTTTRSPGRSYPHLDNTHEYTRKGKVRASVDTTWSADYRVDGGAWAPVPDTVTITGASQPLRVRTATPVLVTAE